MANLTLVALSAVSGVPLFIRHRGSTKSPSYNVVGSLNGVFMFGESQGTKLLDTRTPNSAVTWKTFHDSLRLILIHGEDVVTLSTSQRKLQRSTSGPNHTSHSSSSPQPSSPLVGGPSDRRLLDLVFDSLVLLLSLDALRDITNVERLKKDLKVCYPLLDALLERCEGGGGLFSHLVHCADTVLPADNYNLQAEVGRWCESQCSSSYGCLLSSSGRVLAATRHYWSLSPSELVLLPLLLLAAPAPSTARDIPVYLPNKSPKVPLRLVGMRLTGQVWAVAVCGPAPSLACAVRAASTFWPPYYTGLETLAATQPYNLTAAARQALDKAVLGLLLVNYETKRCVSCVHLGPSHKGSPSGPGTDKNTQLSRAGTSTPALPSSNTNTIKSSRAAPLTTTNNINVAVTNTLRNNNNNGDTRSRKTVASTSTSKGMQLHSPPPSQTNTLKSSSSSKVGAPTIHTYQTVELNISPVQPRRALSPRSNGSRALSPSSGSRALSPSKGSRALSPSSGSRALSPSRSRALSPSKGSRALSPGGGSRVTSSAGGGDGSRALSPSSRPSSQLIRALSPGAATVMSPKSSVARRASSPSGRANPSSSRSQRALSPTASHRSGSPNTSTMKSGKSLSGGHCPSAASPMTPNFKMAALASVYRGLVGGLLQSPGLPSGDTPPVNIEAGHVVSEAYVWCGSCRVYALQTASLHLLVLLPSALPHALARSVTYQTLDVFFKGKNPRV